MILKKKMMALVLAAVTLMGTISMPVMADSRTENFFVYINGGSVISSGSAKKTVKGSMYTYTKTRPGSSITWVQGKETVNLRGRSVMGSTGVTYLGQTTSPSSVNLSYKPGYGKLNSYYKLAVQYDSDNPYEKLDLQCFWRP